MQVLTNDPIELANTLMQAPMYSTPVCVDFEDDDDLPLPNRVSFHDHSSIAVEIVSLPDDTSSDGLCCDMNEEVEIDQSDLYNEIDEFVEHKLYLESQAYLKAPFLTCMKDLLARDKPSNKPASQKRKNRRPKIKANLPKKNDSLIVQKFQSESTNLQSTLDMTRYQNEKCINNNCASKPTTQYYEYHNHHSYYSAHYPNYSNYYSQCHIGHLESSLRGYSNLLVRLNAINATQQAELTHLKQQCVTLEMQASKKTRRCRLKNKNHTGPKKQTMNRRCGVCREYFCNGLGQQILCPKHPNYSPANQDGIVTVTVTKPKKRRKRQCQVCLEYGPEELNLNCEKGSGNQKKCKFFTLDGSPKCQLCQKYDPKELTKNCVVGAKSQVLCKNFELNGTFKVQA